MHKKFENEIQHINTGVSRGNYAESDKKAEALASKL